MRSFYVHEARKITQRPGAEADEQKALRLIAEELKRLKWKPGDLKTRRKGDPGKVQIAKRLRAETTMTLKWIASELHMGVWTHVSNLLSLERNKRSSG